MKKMYEVLSLMPAPPGICAAFKEKPEEGNVSYLSVFAFAVAKVTCGGQPEPNEVIGLALGDGDGNASGEPEDGEGMICEYADNFWGYVRR